MKNHKQQMREQCLAHRRALSKKQNEEFSNRIIQFFREHLEQCYDQPIQILCYRSIADEVDTTALFSGQGKHDYYAPVTHENGDMHWLRCDSNTTWKVGDFRVSEPADGQHWKVDETPAILLCPVVGFDTDGNRIGMGKGCFDRWLAQHKQDFDMIIGLAFECQRCPAIASEPHDIPLDAIITEQGWMRCPNT